MSDHACVFEGCDRPAAVDRAGKPDQGGLCAGHAKQKRRGQNLRPLRKPRSPKALLAEAAIQYADAHDAERAWHRLRVAARRYVLAEKETDPRRGGVRE